MDMINSDVLIVRQKRELAELFGIETRNRYVIYDASGQELYYAAEQQKGFLGMLFRQFLGHWRRFDIHIFTPDRKPTLIAKHPFRWFFQRLEISTPDGRALGALQQRFAFFTKKFDIEDSIGHTVLRVRSPLWKPWTFPIQRLDGQEVALVRKQWSGLLKEAFTDADNFRVELSKQLKPQERLLILAAAFFIDLQYFENKARPTSLADTNG